MSKSRRKSRECAVQGLYQWQLTGHDIADIDTQFIEEHEMANVDVEYFQELLHQVILHLHELDDHIVPLLDRPIQEVDPVERATLRMSSYELGFRPDVPYRVVINEGVELAKTFGAEHGHKYVNSILDGLARKLRSAEIAAPQKSRKPKK